MIYKGWLIDSVDGVVRLEDAQGDTLVFTNDEIVRWHNPFYFVFKDNRFHQKTGKFSALGLGLGGIDQEFTLQFYYIRGKRITPKVSAGVGTGFNFTGKLNQLVGQEFFLELYLYGKYYLTNKRFRPFIEAKGGTMIGIEKRIRDDLYPGLMCQGGLGVEFAQSTPARISLTFNYLYLYALANEISQFNVLDDLKFGRSLFGVTINF